MTIQRQLRNRQPKPLALITSVYDADRFLPRFLKNISQLDGYDDFEHYLIRAGSPGNEGPLLEEHERAFPNTVVYIDLPYDPGLYNVWNLAAQISSARYLSNANVDDQRAPDHARRLLTSLEGGPSLSLASSSIRTTEDPELTWEDSANAPVMFAGGGTRRYGLRELLENRKSEQYAIRDIPHCMPIWRRTLHAQFGYFNEELYGASADSEFWLRVASSGARFYLDATPRGLYLKHDKSYWSRAKPNRVRVKNIRDPYEMVLSSKRDYNEVRDDPLALRFIELWDLYRHKAYLELVGRTISLRSVLVTIGVGETPHRNLAKIANRWLGISSTLLPYVSPSSKPDEFIAAIYDWLSFVVERRPLNGGATVKVVEEAWEDLKNLVASG